MSVLKKLITKIFRLKFGLIARPALITKAILEEKVVMRRQLSFGLTEKFKTRHEFVGFFIPK